MKQSLSNAKFWNIKDCVKLFDEKKVITSDIIPQDYECDKKVEDVNGYLFIIASVCLIIMTISAQKLFWISCI